MPVALVEDPPGPPTVADIPDIAMLGIVGQLPIDLGPSGQLPTRDELLAELRHIHRAMRLWYCREPDQVLREASGYSARLAELRLDAGLAAAVDRQYARLGTHINYAHAEVERQSKWASRLIEVRRQDMDLSR